ncbi:MAG: hypothetical protein ACN0LA_10775 [Candidatus Longimicrobiales bacterium M2_2A_002]
MRQIFRIGLGVALAAGTVAGCGDEDPTEAGSELVGEELRTVEVVLDAPEFLERDTTYDQIGTMALAPFDIVANDFEAELDAHVLVRIERPFRISFTDADSVLVADTIDRLVGGTLTLVVDSLYDPEAPIEFEVLEVTESWDPNSATWTDRVDTVGGAPVPWTVPGGTTGAVLGSATWTQGDTVEIPIDSAAAAVWYDTTGARLGGLVRMVTTGKRVRLKSVNFAFNAVPLETDTVLPAGQVTGRATVASPTPAPAAGELRVGGRPVWRSLLRFRPIEDLMVPCETGSTTCEIPLSEVNVNAANLVLRTQPAGGRRPEGPMRLEGRAVLEGPNIPLTRSPLSRAYGQMLEPLPAGDFAAPADVMVRVPITDFVQRNASRSEDEVPLRWLALAALGERSLFGYGQFGGVASAGPPQLELVVTIPVQKVTQ